MTTTLISRAADRERRYELAGQLAELNYAAHVEAMRGSATYRDKPIAAPKQKRIKQNESTWLCDQLRSLKPNSKVPSSPCPATTLTVDKPKASRLLTVEQTADLLLAITLGPGYRANRLVLEMMEVMKETTVEVGINCLDKNYLGEEPTTHGSTTPITTRLGLGVPTPTKEAN